MSLRVVLTLQVGLDTFVIGPPGAIGGRSDGRQIGRPGVNGRADARRWFIRACQEPGALLRLRQHLVLWSGDAHHINLVSERDLPDYLAALCAQGSLSIWASRPLGGHDAQNLARVKLDSGSGGSVDTWSITARTESVLQSVPDYLTGSCRDEFVKLVSPDAIKMTVGVFVVWAAGHSFGVSEVIDVILLALAVYTLGRSAREIAEKITHVLHLITCAHREEDLRQAARELAEVVAVIGVAALAALITHAATKVSKGAFKAKKEPVRKGPAPRSEPVQRIQERPQPNTPNEPTVSQSGARGSDGKNPAGSIGTSKASNPPIDRYVRPEPASMTNEEARAWYHSQLDRIPKIIDRNAPLETQAKQAHAFRNEVKLAARDAMIDQVEANKLNREKPPMEWDAAVKKYEARGFSGGDLYQKIIEGSEKSNPTVDAKLQMKRRKIDD